MSIAHSQAYSFRHWYRPYANEGRAMWGYWWIELKEHFLAAGWTVMGTYNGVDAAFNDGDRDLVDGVGGGAGTDTFNAPNLAYTSKQPWIVMQCPPSMGVMQIMLATTQGMSSNPVYGDIRTSPTGSFMAINGGVDGNTAGTEPQAPDQITHISNGGWGLSQTASYSVDIHSCWSADKTQFFLTVQQEGVPAWLIGFSALDNAHANLENGGLLHTVNLSSNEANVPTESRMANQYHYTSALWWGRVSGNNESFYIGGRGWANLGTQSLDRIQESGEAEGGPCEAYVGSVPIRGYYGTIPDMYWVPNSHYNQGFGDAVGGPIKWFCGGSLVIPWDSAEPLPRIR